MDPFPSEQPSWPDSMSHHSPCADRFQSTARAHAHQSATKVVCRKNNSLIFLSILLGFLGRAAGDSSTTPTTQFAAYSPGKTAPLAVTIEANVIATAGREEPFDSYYDLLTLPGSSSLSDLGLDTKNASVRGGLASYGEPEPGFLSFILLMFCGVLIVLTVVGNICVIAAVHQSKALQAPQNALIVSLALADLLVGFAVMPFAAITDFLGLWILGAIPCDIWTVLDVCLCTASILHLVAIAFDRYFSITNMRYIQGRNVKLMYLVITIVWLLSLVLAVGPAMGWRDNLYDERIAKGECLVSQDVSFQIFGTSVAFFGPLAGILILYGLIYQQTRSRMRKRMEDTLHSTLHQIAKIDKEAASGQPPSSALSTPPSTPTSTGTNGLQLASIFNDGKWTSRFRASRPFRRSFQKSTPTSKSPQRKYSNTRTGGSTQTIRLSEMGPEENETTAALGAINSLPLTTTDDTASVCPSFTDTPEMAKLRTAKKPSTSLSQRHQTLLRREKKAATTLAIITLSFVVCWLPFFLYAVVRPVCGESCQLPHAVESFFLWLGYANSTLNPLIYTIFSPDFRNAFKKLFRLDSSPLMT